MNLTCMVDSDWQALLQRLGVELEKSARQFGALRRRRGVPDAGALLRLALVYGATPLSLRTTAGWAMAAGVATVSDVALLYRLQSCEAWLGWIFGSALAAEMRSLVPDIASGSWRLRAVDGLVIKRTDHLAHPGWRLHASYDLAAGRFDDVQLATAGEGERLDRFEARPGVFWWPIAVSQEPEPYTRRQARVPILSCVGARVPAVCSTNMVHH